MRLLVPLALVGRPYFCLVPEVSTLGLNIGLAIVEMESIGEKVTVGFSGYLSGRY